MTQGKPLFSIINNFQTIFDSRKEMRWNERLKLTSLKSSIWKNVPLISKRKYTGKFIFQYITVYLANINVVLDLILTARLTLCFHCEYLQTTIHCSLKQTFVIQESVAFYFSPCFGLCAFSPFSKHEVIYFWKEK